MDVLGARLHLGGFARRAALDRAGVAFAEQRGFERHIFADPARRRRAGAPSALAVGLRSCSPRGRVAAAAAAAAACPAATRGLHVVHVVFINHAVATGSCCTSAVGSAATRGVHVVDVVFINAVCKRCWCCDV